LSIMSLPIRRCCFISQFLTLLTMALVVSLWMKSIGNPTVAWCTNYLAAAADSCSDSWLR
jgi:hypothetical protein